MNYIVEYKEKEINNLHNILDIEEKIKNNQVLTKSEAEAFLDFIVYQVRNKINSINGNNYINKCDLSQSIICHYLNSLKCPNFAINTQEAISKDIMGHSFNTVILNIDGKLNGYLIDPTYIQFFTKERCNKDFYYIYRNLILRTPDPGYFIKKEDKPVIEDFLSNGYASLNEEFCRIYGDSFLNTKNGILVSQAEYKTIDGKVYNHSFLKPSKFPISKSIEELDELSLSIKDTNEKMM